MRWKKERNSVSRCVERKRRGELLRNNLRGGKQRLGAGQLAEGNE
jgi:hypothetical protein